MIPNLNDLKFDSIKLAEKKRYPQATIIYGSGGIGKTTVASFAESPVIVPIGRETGTQLFSNKGIPCFEAPEGMEPLGFVFAAIAKLLKSDHNRKTVIFDNLGTYREAVDEDVEKDAGKEVKLDAYGKRQALSYPYYTRLLAGFDLLMKKKGMDVVLICHAAPVNINLPNGDYYQKTSVHAQRGDNTSVAGLLEARFHNVFYLKGEARTLKTKGAVGQDKIISTGGLKRTLYTKETATYFAKSRVELEEFYEIGDDESIKKLWADVHA